MVAKELEIWAFHTTPNAYVPYGTVNRCRRKARTVAEYHELIRQRDENNRRMNEERSALAKQRQKDKADQNEKRKEEHRGSNAEREKDIRELEAIIDPVVRLEKIARHSNQSIWYFPAQFARISDGDVRRVDSQTREQLLKKIGSKRKGEWGRLGKLLDNEPHREKTPCSEQ